MVYYIVLFYVYKNKKITKKTLYSSRQLFYLIKSCAIIL